MHYDFTQPFVPKFYRLPIIRHIRFYWHSWRLHLWVMSWCSVGIGMGIPNKSDIDHLEKIWRGEA